MNRMTMLELRRVDTGSRVRRGLLALAAGAVVLGGVACTGPGHRPPPGTRSTTTSSIPPRPGACHDIDFAEATVDSRPSSPTGSHYVLTVSGVVPNSRYQVHLEPVTYVRQPEYWLIQVVACAAGDVGGDVQTPFKVSLDLTGLLGTQGIEVTGPTTRQRIDVPAKAPAPLANSGWVLDLASLGVPAAGRRITLSFSATELSGNSACNTYSAAYTATGSPTAGSLEIGPVRSTLIGCTADVATAEAAFLRKLQAVTSYHVADDRLRLTGPKGSLVFGTPPPTHP
jgi:heat shock protein HslJ